MDGRCPWCGASLGELLYNGQYRGALGAAVSPESGVLWWECPECHRGWHRWPKGSKPWLLAGKYHGALKPGWAGRETTEQ